MFRIGKIVVCLLVGAVFAHGADSSLTDARRAQVELGSDIWSQVIRIENTSPTSTYPRELHALVFELADVLWFYASFDGTQSLSLRRGQTIADRADLSPLLLEIDPGFVRWRTVKTDRVAPVARRGDLPNGCFIKCVAALRGLRARGIAAANAQLLSYYVETAEGRRGHTVLVYESGGGLAVIDPVNPGNVQRFPAALARDALALARELVDGRVAKARWLPFDLPAPLAEIVAGVDPAGASLVALELRDRAERRGTAFGREIRQIRRTNRSRSSRGASRRGRVGRTIFTDGRGPASSGRNHVERHATGTVWSYKETEPRAA